MIDWDDAFANMAHVQGSEKLPEFWASRAARYREEHKAIEQDIPYGSSEREVFDLVMPDTKPKGLAVFVHGGFWMRLDKSYWTDLAEGARAQGWAVCIPSYTLTPEARIFEITRQIAACITKAANRIDGPVRLIGHSAGGHLVTRMLCDDVSLADEVRQRIEHTISLSGLHDLRPLLHTKMNETLGLTLEEATLESAALSVPVGQPRLTAWVGGGERPEFIRQSRLMAIMWKSFDCDTQLVIEDQHNHFTVLEALKDKNSDLVKAFIG